MKGSTRKLGSTSAFVFRESAIRSLCRWSLSLCQSVISSVYDPGSFQAATSVLGLGVDLRASPERGKSQFPVALQLSWTSAPKGFKARCYGGSYSQGRTGAGEPNGELNPLTPQSWAGGVLHGWGISLPLLDHCPEGVSSD